MALEEKDLFTLQKWQENQAVPQVGSSTCGSDMTIRSDANVIFVIQSSVFCSF